MCCIKTQRLILREFNREDCQDLALILSDSLTMRFSLTGALSPSQTEEKINQFIASYRRFGFGKWAVTLRESHELIGYCGVAIETIDDKEEREIGYRLCSRFWGRGLATEAAMGAMKYGFEQLNFPYILAIVERENKASIRVLQKIGMRYKKETVFHGVEMDVYQADAAIQLT